MIRTRRELKEYMLEDAKALNRSKTRPRLFGDDIWKFQLLMRKCSYYKTRSETNPLYILVSSFYQYIYYKRSVKLGYSIPFHVFEKGLSIAHRGTIVVSSKSTIGKNCRIHACVNIGVSGKSGAPKIGDNVYIGPGVKIVGDISIADGVCLGAGAVVVKSITEPNTTWAGVPAKKISDNSSRKMLCDKLFEI